MKPLQYVLYEHKTFGWPRQLRWAEEPKCAPHAGAPRRGRKSIAQIALLKSTPSTAYLQYEKPRFPTRSDEKKNNKERQKDVMYTAGAGP